MAEVRMTQVKTACQCAGHDAGRQGGALRQAVPADNHPSPSNDACMMYALHLPLIQAHRLRERAARQ